MMKGRLTGGHVIKINGQTYNVILARIAFVCEVCHAELKRKDFGLKCSANQHHRGYIKKRTAEKVTINQQENINQLKQVYKIVDGKVQLA